ncbi:type III secretion system cytoplasmic ring protein SctQ [Salinicola halimionae]|uniref:type III secretion system cytoplasmic ring protein SctQ n=1 Tax=Salinicola halimionae TaxID=1949081 RepID=UPI00130090FC|nr:type III secretion system cytoplasmic ring protein SctQ [Salinicola halimionae]
MTNLSSTPAAARSRPLFETAGSPDDATAARVIPLSISALPHVEASRFALHNALHVARQPLEFDWHGRAASLRLLPAGARVEESPALEERLALGEARAITLCLGEERLTLSGNARAFDRLGQHPDRRRELDDVDAELAAMWLEVVWLEWLEPLEAALNAEIRLLPGEPKPPAHTMRLCLTLELDGESHPLTLDLAVPVAERLLPQFDHAFPAQRAPANGVISTLRVECGKQMLTLGEFRSLRSGDVVILDTATVEEVQLNLAGRFSCRARFSEAGLKATGPLIANHPEPNSNPSHEESVMSEPPVDQSESPTQAPSETDAAMDSLPVQMTCELGRLDMSLGELRKLGEGSVLPLERQPERAVDLVVNGQRMGRGRLIAIGDAIGVQIERLSLETGPAGDD